MTWTKTGAAQYHAKLGLLGWAVKGLVVCQRTFDRIITITQTITQDLGQIFTNISC